MIAGGAEAGVYEAVVGGFAAMRALSTRNDDPAAASRPFDTGRDGFVIGEGAGVVDPRGARARRGARRDDPGRAGRLWRDRRCLAHHAAGAGRDRRRPGGQACAREGGHDAGRHRPRQRPRDLDPRGRQVGAPGDPHDLRRRRRADLGDRQQVDDGSHPGRRGSDRGDRHDPDHPRRLRPADHQPRRRRTRGGGHGPDPERRQEAGHPRRAEQLVRVRRPEHGAHLHGPPADDRRVGGRPRRRSRATAATSSCSR